MSNISAVAGPNIKCMKPWRHGGLITVKLTFLVPISHLTFSSHSHSYRVAPLATTLSCSCPLALFLSMSFLSMEFSSLLTHYCNIVLALCAPAIPFTPIPNDHHFSHKFLDLPLLFQLHVTNTITNTRKYTVLEYIVISF